MCVCVWGLPHLDLILPLELARMSSRNPFRAGSRQMNVSSAYLVWVPKGATSGQGRGSLRNELNYYANDKRVRKCLPVQHINKTLGNLCRGQAGEAHCKCHLKHLRCLQGTTSTLQRFLTRISFTNTPLTSPLPHSLSSLARSFRLHRQGPTS